MLTKDPIPHHGKGSTTDRPPPRWCVRQPMSTIQCCTEGKFGKKSSFSAADRKRSIPTERFWIDALWICICYLLGSISLSSISSWFVSNIYRMNDTLGNHNISIARTSIPSRNFPFTYDYIYYLQCNDSPDWCVITHLQ